MKIFISHSQTDNRLASKLKKILESDPKIKRAYMFEKTPKYGIQIDQKITKEIVRCDYVIALITKNSKTSASVNQELGYSQAKNKQTIPMIEKNAKSGFLIYSTDKIIFTRKNFEKSCEKARKYIIQNGVPERDEDVFSPQEISVQKSAHFRFKFEIELLDILDSVLYRLLGWPDKDRDDLTSNNVTKRKRVLTKLNKFFNSSSDKTFSYFTKLGLDRLQRFQSDYDYFTEQIDYVTRFPHDNLLLHEHNAYLKLKERILSITGEKFNLEHYARLVLEKQYTTTDYTFEEIIEQHENIRQLPRHARLVISQLTSFVNIVISMQNEIDRIRIKHGELAFKDTEVYL